MSRDLEREPIHDGELRTPAGCPRGLVCWPIARVSSEGFESFMCCGDNRGDAPVPADRYRLCIKSTHDQKPADVIVNLDPRDVADTVYVLTGAMSAHMTGAVLGVGDPWALP